MPALGQRVGGQRGHHPGGQPAAPVGVVHGHGADDQPSVGEHATCDGRQRRGGGVEAHRGEQRAIGVPEHGGGRGGQRSAPVPVAGQPGVVGLGRQGNGDVVGRARPRSQRRGEHEVVLVPGPARGRERVVRGDRPRGRDGGARPQAPVLVPAGDVADRRRRVRRWIPDDEHGVGAAGEPTTGPQQPAPERLLFQPAPGPRRQAFEVVDGSGRDGAHGDDPGARPP